MISVNLLYSKALKSGEAEASTIDSNDFKLGPDFQTSEYSLGGQILKLILIVGFLGAMVFFEKMRGAEGIKELQLRQQELTSLRAIDESKQEELNNFEEVKAELSLLKKQNVEVSAIKKDRLFLIQSLDVLQSAVPQDLWLTSVGYKDHEVFIDGGALSQEELNAFVGYLRKNPIFSRVIVVKDSEVEVAGQRRVLEFSILVRVRLSQIQKQKKEQES